MTKLTVARALTAHVAKRFIRLATMVASGALVLIFIITLALAYFFSAWWWLLIVPFVLIFSIFLVVRLFVVLIITRVHSERLSKIQREALDEFVDKIQALIEARSIPLPFVVFICIKDIVLHRDITTIKKLIKNSAGLRADYSTLEKLF